MKTFLRLLIVFAAVAAARASNMASSSFTTKDITLTGTAYDVSFSVQWTCDDFPMTGAPGLVQLLDSSGQQVAEVAACLYDNGPEYTTTGGQDSLTDINTWGAVFTPGGQVADGGLSAVWHLRGLSPGNYTLKLWRYTTWDGSYHATTIWTYTFFDGGSDPTPPSPVNTPPTVTLLSPGDQTVTAGTTLTITAHATDPDGNITSHNLDIQRPAGDWNWQGGFATGEPYQGGPVGSGSDSTRSASFTFTDVGTYYVRSAADDGSGWVQSATVAITVVAPPALQYLLATSAGAGGTVSPGGTYDAGTVVYISAVPDGTHDFTGWSGDAAGSANPVAVVMDRAKSVTANFSARLFPLTTSATTGGGVTPGGSYPYGTSVTVTASPDAAHRFLGWTGDASGSESAIVLTLTSPLNVQAVFTDKTAQTITFASPGNQPASATLTLGGSASSGLPVTYQVLSGPATIAGNQLQITGPGAVTIQASQGGDGFYLPAPSVSQTFNAVASAILKYRPAGRTVFTASATNGTTPFVLEKP